MPSAEAPANAAPALRMRRRVVRIMVSPSPDLLSRFDPRGLPRVCEIVRGPFLLSHYRSERRAEVKDLRCRTTHFTYPPRGGCPAVPLRAPKAADSRLAA